MGCQQQWKASVQTGQQAAGVVVANSLVCRGCWSGGVEGDKRPHKLLRCQMKARQDCKGATLHLLGGWHYTGECGFYVLLHCSCSM